LIRTGSKEEHHLAMTNLEVPSCAHSSADHVRYLFQARKSWRNKRQETVKLKPFSDKFLNF
jgi:hypothetical protein